MKTRHLLDLVLAEQEASRAHTAARKALNVAAMGLVPGQYLVDGYLLRVHEPDGSWDRPDRTVTALELRKDEIISRSAY